MLIITWNWYLLLSYAQTAHTVKYRRKKTLIHSQKALGSKMKVQWCHLGGLSTGIFTGYMQHILCIASFRNFTHIYPGRPFSHSVGLLEIWGGGRHAFFLHNLSTSQSFKATAHKGQTCQKNIVFPSILKKNVGQNGYLLTFYWWVSGLVNQVGQRDLCANYGQFSQRTPTSHQINAADSFHC